jgi:hypothetical protein
MKEQHMHYQGHLRDAFLAWLEDGMPEVTMVEVDYEMVAWPAQRLLGRMVHCTDTVPAESVREATEGMLRPPRRQTHGALAQALLRERAATRS